MNLFEKIFNHQIISRLEDSGTFMVTSHERSWLKTMLEHPAATIAFTADTLEKLRSALEQEPVMNSSLHVIEKARPIEKQVYHPLLRSLRRHMMNQSGIQVTYEIKGGRIHPAQSGFPYKLEYSMIKREWYLLWYHVRQNTFMSTKLKNILVVTPEPIESIKVESILKRIEKIIQSRRNEISIEIVPQYNAELSRILYAFSSFEKSVEYTPENNTYLVHVSLLSDELEYLLSKIRFLGKRVRIVKGKHVKKRMLDSSIKALERYGITDGDQNMMI